MMNYRRSFITLYNLFYIIFCILWPLFQRYYFKVDGAGYTLIALSAFVLFFNMDELRNHKMAFAKPAFRCWVVLVLYSMLNAFLKGFYAKYGVLSFLNANFFLPLILLVIAMLELHKDRVRCLKAIWISLGIYLFIGLPFMGGDYSDRALIEGIGNLYPLHAVAFLFVSAVLLIEGRLKTWAFGIIAFFISILILLSGTRKAFGAEIIILLGVILNNRKRKDIWFYIKMTLLGFVLLVFVRFSMMNSLMGERMEESGETVQQVRLVENQRINDFLLILLDDRSIQYEMGLELFHQHFWTGIGLTNYADVARVTYRLHTEYMVQLCENGFIGFALFVLFYVQMIIAMHKAKKRTKPKIINIILFGIGTLLFLNMTCWTYNQNYVMLFYAIILSYAESKRKFYLSKDKQ